MIESIAIPTLVILTILYAIRRFTKISIADVPGPKAESFLLGTFMLSH